MRQFSVPARFEVPADSSLSDDVFDAARERPDSTVCLRRTAEGWTPVTAATLAEQVRRLAAGLIAKGIAAGDRVAILSRTRYEWMVCDYAILTVGAVTVPIYETSSPEQVWWIMSDSGAVAIFAETADNVAVVEELRERFPDLQHVWCLDAGAVDEVTATGRDVSDETVDARRAQVHASDLATIVYTSGTTGRPKGCMLTHGNLSAESGNVVLGDGMPEVFNETKTALLFLPLAHVLNRSIQLSAIRCGVVIGHVPTTTSLLEDLASFRPHLVLSVPRIFEKIYNSAKRKAHKEGKGRIFDLAERVAIRYSESLDAGGPGLLLRAEHKVFDTLVYGKIRAVLGGRVEYAVSGGAPLGARLGHFFRGAGITVLEGWGLTETSNATTVTLPKALKVGTVGQPIPGASVRIADDGEILVHGPIVFQGYWHNDAATREVFTEDGWFRTGDIGELDEDGFLRITGRKKDLIVTAGGKNVAPAVLEDRLRAHWLVSNCLVVGDARPYVGVLVTLDEEAVVQWAQDRGAPEPRSVADVLADPALQAEVQAAVDTANAAVSKAESIRRFRVLTHDFTIDQGELTPTLKLRRDMVMKQYAADVDALYD